MVLEAIALWAISSYSYGYYLYRREQKEIQQRKIQEFYPKDVLDAFKGANDRMRDRLDKRVIKALNTSTPITFSGLPNELEKRLIEERLQELEDAKDRTV